MSAFETATRRSERPGVGEGTLPPSSGQTHLRPFGATILLPTFCHSFIGVVDLIGGGTSPVCC
jgi:hypothetical protein